MKCFFELVYPKKMELHDFISMEFDFLSEDKDDDTGETILNFSRVKFLKADLSYLEFDSAAIVCRPHPQGNWDYC